MNSSIFNINFRDVSKGLVVAGLAVVLGSLQQGIEAHGLDFAAYDWYGILDLAVKAMGAYLVKNLFSDEQGKVLGKIG